MFSDKEVLLKSLHVCLKLPIVVFDSEFNMIKEYRSDRTTCLFYD
ncbi:YSIRK-targeted surface antigen transcriptional regulator, partial [Enterococcus faecium]|nr:YSIRK-targeted surface antigen transcriptional regulator [Enterococcus faecium]EKZ0036868.1 YSIRK-targeted surface antigen transcriptional regulator [Enterococcus faecium]